MHRKLIFLHSHSIHKGFGFPWFLYSHQICQLLSSTFGTETAYQVWYKENHTLILEKPLILSWLEMPLTITDKTEVHPARMFSPINEFSGFCSKSGPKKCKYRQEIKLTIQNHKWPAQWRLSKLEEMYNWLKLATVILNPFYHHHSSIHSKWKYCVNYELCSMPGMLADLGPGAVVASELQSKGSFTGFQSASKVSSSLSWKYLKLF